MTRQRDFKKIIRERQRNTGESYTAARRHVMRVRAELLGIADRTKDETSPCEDDEHQPLPKETE